MQKSINYRANKSKSKLIENKVYFFVKKMFKIIETVNHLEKKKLTRAAIFYPQYSIIVAR